DHSSPFPPGAGAPGRAGAEPGELLHQPAGGAGLRQGPRLPRSARHSMSCLRYWYSSSVRPWLSLPRSLDAWKDQTAFRNSGGRPTKPSATAITYATPSTAYAVVFASQSYSQLLTFPL